MLNEFNEKQKEMEISKMNKKAEEAVKKAVKEAVKRAKIRVPIQLQLIINIISPIPIFPFPFPHISPIRPFGQLIDLIISICEIYEINKECYSKIIDKIKVEIPQVISSICIGNNRIDGEIAGVITLSIGRAFIEVCKKVKLGEIKESDIASSIGETIIKERFNEEMRYYNILVGK
ncbi:hypothetical protein [Peptoanaerobacter stomatis]